MSGCALLFSCGSAVSELRISSSESREQRGDFLKGTDAARGVGLGEGRCAGRVQETTREDVSVCVATCVREWLPDPASHLQSLLLFQVRLLCFARITHAARFCVIERGETARLLP